MLALPGVSLDTYTVARTVAGVPLTDEEGNTYTGDAEHGVVHTGRGTFGVLSASAQANAARAGYAATAALTTTEGFNFTVGDLVTVNGNTYRVTAIKPTRITRRVFLADDTMGV